MAGKGGNPLNHNATSSSEFLFDPMNDAAFKSLIRAEETRDVVTGVLSDLTPIPEEVMKESQFTGGEVPKDILKEKGMVSDIVVRVQDKNKIIIEANRQYSENMFDKNASYVFKNSYMESNVGSNLYHSIIIINVDGFNRFHTEKPILIFNIRDEDGHVETELYTSIHLVLENFDNPKYTISERVRNFMEFFQNKPDTIANLKEKYKDGEIMAFVNKAEELSKSTEFINYYNYEENHESEKMDFYNTGKNEGKLEGQQQRSIEIAKNLLDLDIEINKIVKATGLTAEEINRLKESSNKDE